MDKFKNKPFVRLKGPILAKIFQTMEDLGGGVDHPVHIFWHLGYRRSPSMATIQKYLRILEINGYVQRGKNSMRYTMTANGKRLFSKIRKDANA